MENIRLVEGVSQKFIVARLMHDGANADYIWGSPGVEWHKDLLKNIQQAGYELVEVKGGGWIKVDTDLKEVYLWGESSRFGPPPVDVLRTVLGHAYSEYKLLMDQAPTER